MRLLKLYEAILKYCSMEPDQNDRIDVVTKSGRKPAMIDEDQLVMPTMKNLRGDPDDKVIIFHPLREYIDRGESVVVKKLRLHLNVKLNFAVYTMACELFRIIADTANHDRLSPEQRELLLQVKNVDSGTEARFSDFVIKKYAELTSRYFVNIYLKKSGTYKGEKHARVGVVSFPFYEMLKDPSLKMGRVNDREIFKSMLAFIFPGSLDDSEEWNSFSDSRNAPWLECLLKTSYKLAERINELSHLYRDFLSDREDFLFNTDWVEALDNLDKYEKEIMDIPTQRGNEGTLPQGTDSGTIARKEAPALPQTTTAKREAPPPDASPTLPPPRSQRERQEGHPAPHAQVPVRGQVPVRQQGYQQGYDQRQAYQPPEPPPAVLPDGTLDLDAVLATNPAVAAGMYAPTPLMAWHQSQQQQRQPYAPGYDPRMQGGYPGGYHPGYGAPGGYPVQQGYGYPQRPAPAPAHGWRGAPGQAPGGYPGRGGYPTGRINDV